jgi:hypothetical protein
MIRYGQPVQLGSPDKRCRESGNDWGVSNPSGESSGSDGILRVELSRSGIEAVPLPDFRSEADGGMHDCSADCRVGVLSRETGGM